jgi:hypothetical protein
MRRADGGARGNIRATDEQNTTVTSAVRLSEERLQVVGGEEGGLKGYFRRRGASVPVCVFLVQLLNYVGVSGRQGADSGYTA